MAKSHLHPGDIRRVISQASKKKPPPPDKPDTRSVSFHHSEFPEDYRIPFWTRLSPPHWFWLLASFLFFVASLLSVIQPTDLHHTQDFYTVSATKRTVHSARGALVDRGANGGIAGNDVKIVSKTGRTINVTGINNHQLTNIPIGTVAAHAVSQRGECILIMHQYAIHQTNRSIHSCVQLEHFNNTVDDRSLKAGGLQRITTLDGYVFPLDIIEGLPYIKMRIPSDEEYATLPHVVLTADLPFRYNSMDCTLSDKSDWYKNTSDWSEGLKESPFHLNGEYKHLDAEYELDFHYLFDLDSLPSLDDIDVHRAIQHVPLTRDCNALRPYFLNVPAHVVQHTLDATTQYARNIEAGPEMYKTHRSPFPALNVRRRNEPVATDTVEMNVAAVDSGGIKYAQIFVGRESLVVDIYGMKKQSQFVNTLLDNIRQRGAMDTLISDRAAVEISQRVLDVLRHLFIGSWQSTPYMQHQNFAERRWKDIKRLANWIMGYKGAPANCWLLALEYVADVMNLTAVESLNWRTPLEKLTGQTPDSSILMLFVFYDKVYYTPNLDPSFPSDTTEEKGRMVGFSKNVGHAMTYKVLTDDTQKVLHKCLIRRIDEPNRRLDPDPPAQYPAIIRSLSDDSVPEGSDDLPTMPTLPAIDTDAIYEKIDQERLQSSRNHGEQENGEPDAHQVDLGRTVLMPPKKDGQRFRAQIIERVQEYHKGLEQAREKNPNYRVLVGHDGGEKWEEIVAYNDLMNLISDTDATDGVWKFRKIKSHQGPLLPSDKRYKGSRYNVLVEWETGECSLEPLNALTQQGAILGLYAREHGLLEEPGWKQFKKYAKRTKKLTRLVNQAKLHSFRTAPFYQHGYLVPRNHAQAMELDAKNGKHLMGRLRIPGIVSDH